MSRIAILIPARRGSTRLADKLLLDESGQALLLHTCQGAAEAFGAGALHVCADDPVLVDCARGAGFQAHMTAGHHRSGTDRIAEIAAGLDAEILVNVQADEPEIDPDHIRLVADLLDQHPWAGMATLACPGDAGTQSDPNQVKALVDGMRAVYFTRAPCPWDRAKAAPFGFGLRHIGLYAYRRDVLLGYHDLPSSQLETIEQLEQLRALAAGIGIACAVVDESAPGIDVRADYDAFLQRQGSAS